MANPKTKKPNNSPEITAKKRAEGKDLGGRPPFIINYDQLEKLCGIFCTEDECASILGCSRDTLNLRLRQDYQKALKENPEEEPENRYNGWSACFKKMSSKGRMSLRREQFRMAVGAFNAKGDLVMKPDKGMLIWLGKNHLEQSDRIDHTTKNKPLPGATGLDLSQLSDKEFKQFGLLVKKAKEQGDEKPSTDKVH